MPEHYSVWDEASIDHTADGYPLDLQEPLSREEEELLSTNAEAVAQQSSHINRPAKRPLPEDLTAQAELLHLTDRQLHAAGWSRAELLEAIAHTVSSMRTTEWLPSGELPRVDR